jgi:hypothetical protein
VYSVKVMGEKEAIARLRAIRGALGELLATSLTAGALPLVNEAKRRCPFRRGNLRRSLHFAITAAAFDYAEGNAGTNVEYARAQEEGATIVPVHAKMLHWVDEDGQDIFAREVTLPPRPYLRPAYDGTTQIVIDTFGRAFGLQLRRFAA